MKPPSNYGTLKPEFIRKDLLLATNLILIHFGSPEGAKFKTKQKQQQNKQITFLFISYQQGSFLVIHEWL